MKRTNLILFLIILLGTPCMVNAQDENSLKISGELLTDERMLLKDNNNWAWNENRLTLKLNKKLDNSKFYSEVWLRNIGLPNLTKSADLYNKNWLSA